MGNPSKDYRADKHGTAHGQWYFDFKDSKQAFELFYRKKKMDSDYCLVISANWLTSGYWIERKPEPDLEVHIYRSVKAAKALEKRIEDRIEASKERFLSGQPAASIGLVL